VSVEDNGKGFDPDGAGFTASSGRGLKTLKERIDLVGGSMDISSAAGKGTKVALVVPT
jgi:signal transduction histidine kinase